ncbi:KilA-N domain-containing protein [Haliscomenobacter sp.]|uniref:KilA-N domain-containing protein n=1 Tax=Haliscomenobacter sp. TaxID=2717303 RepID=UPI003594236B
MAKNSSFVVQGTEIRLFIQKEEDYISLTDIAKRVNHRSEIVIQNWIRNRDTVEFLGVWEQLLNPVFRTQAGMNSFVLSPKQWIQKTDAIGLQSKAGKNGGT